MLETLASEQTAFPGGMGPTKVAEIVGCDKSQAYRTLQTLLGLGFVERTDSGRYRLSWKLYGLAMRGLDQHLVRIASPVLRALSRQTGHRVYLVVLQGADVLTLWSEAGQAGKERMWPVGRLWPAYASASGRALLLHRQRDELHSIFGDGELQKFTLSTPQDIDELFDRICEDRYRGYALGYGEFIEDTFTIGVPIYDPNRKVVGAIAVAGRGPEFAAEMTSTSRLALEAATRIRGTM